MKKFIALFLIVFIVLSACGPKPMYKTRAGKKKLKHYNSLQYGDPRPK